MPPRPIRRSLSATKLVLLSFLCLLVSHLGINTFVPSLAINAVGIALVVTILAWVLFSRKDVFGFLLIIFFCSQFRIANNQAGLFNLAAFVLLSVYLATRNVRETGVRGDLMIALPLAVLFISNTLGLAIRSPMPMVFRGLQFAAFTGILMAFYAASNMRMTNERIRTLAYVLGVAVVYDLFVSINQHYAVIQIPSPLLGLSESLFYEATNAFGSFGSASMNGQFAMMMLTVLLPLICASASRRQLRLGPLFFGFVCVICATILVLANMRAAALASAVTVAVYMIMFSVVYRRSFKYAKYLNRFAVVTVVFLVFFGAAVGLQNIAADFEAVVVEDSSDVLSGEALNRLGPWKAGWINLTERSWILGYGHGISTSNQLAWGGRQLRSGRMLGGGHLHNLYLALPTLYGWFGALAYVTLLLTVAYRLYRSVRGYSFDIVPVVMALGFLVSSTLFLLDEIKSGHAVQYFNLPMMFFIWFGFGLATVRTIDEKARENRRAKAHDPLTAPTG